MTIYHAREESSHKRLKRIFVRLPEPVLGTNGEIASRVVCARRPRNAFLGLKGDSEIWFQLFINSSLLDGVAFA